MVAADAHGHPLTLLGAEPVLALRAHRDREGARVVLDHADGRREERTADPFAVLRDVLRERSLTHVPGEAPLPLLSGAVGYVGYECGQLLEQLPAKARSGSGLPDLALFFHDWVLGQRDDTGETW